MKPPKHLSTTSKRLFKNVCESYELENHHLALLQKACEALDRADQAREAIAEHGLTFVNRAGNRVPVPEIAIERDSRLAFNKIMKDLLRVLKRPKEKPSEFTKRFGNL